MHITHAHAHTHTHTHTHIYIRGVIKKFVDWCDKINTQWALLTNFVRNIKQQIFYLLLKFKLNTLKINHFIIKHKLHGTVTRRSGSWVSIHEGMKKKLSGPLDILNLSIFLSCTFKVILVVFVDVFEEFFIFAVIMDPFRTSLLAP